MRRLQGFFIFSMFIILSYGTVLADSGVVVDPGTGQSYQRFDAQIDWHGAKAACEGLGGYLATITSQAENTFVYSNVGVAGRDHWLGATDEVAEGTWVWVTGEPWAYTNWGTGEPNNLGDQDYLTYWYQEASKWNDQLVNAVRANWGYICEWDPECTGPGDCDDQNVCTDDACVAFICEHTNNTMSCNDGDSCTMDDVCANGTCSGVPLDGDHDGYTSEECGGTDCNDSDAAINPGVTEAAFGDAICEDQVDNDCDGLTDLQDNGCQECTLPAHCNDGNPCTDDDCVNHECVYVNNTDRDQDGYPGELCGGNDCNDSDPTVNPGVYEAYAGDPVCEDGVDNNCNGYTDGDDAGCVPAPDWAASAGADASTYQSGGTGTGSSISNLLVSLMLPMGAVFLLRRIFRKR